MGRINFNIRFITPLLIHGSDSRKCDSAGLTGKALRGCWRFWFRALIGGMVPNITRDALLEFEGKVFGSSNEEIGSKFRLVITPIGNLIQNNSINPGFPSNFTFSGFSKDSKFMINIIPRKNMDKEINILLATIWLWANLGGIGQRERRGFGSPVIGLNNYLNPFQDLKLPIIPYFSNENEIKSFFHEGLNKIWIIFEEWLQNTKLKVKGNITTNPVPTTKYFVISSLEQIAIGGNPYSNMDLAIEAAHGNDECKSIGWARNRWKIPDFGYEQLKSPSRMASPIYTRFHLLDSKKLVPVITWCEQNIFIKTETKINNQWIENNRNLIIPDKKCLESYLKGGICKHGLKFTGLGVKKP